jgi:hypothetical protein
MGRSTKQKIDKELQESKKIMNSFIVHNQNIKTKSKIIKEPIYKILLDYEKKFINNPSNYQLKTKSKNEDKQLLEYVKFVFGKYPVCNPLLNNWIQQKNINDKYQQMFKDWYICVATGGSLYKDHCKDVLTKKEVHYLLNCSYDFSSKKAVVYSIAKANKSTEGNSLKISQSKIVDKPFFNPFWKSVICFFAINETNNLAQLNDILDYVEHKHNENTTFSMAGQTVKNLLEKMHDWHRSLQRIKDIGNHSWNGCHIPDKTYTHTDSLGDDFTWHFHQIKNSKELAAEGNKMRHCVFSYRDKCINNSISIWSLSKTENYNLNSPKITIELRNDGTIIQARGLANRAPRNEERHIIKKWSTENGLSISSYI